MQITELLITKSIGHRTLDRLNINMGGRLVFHISSIDIYFRTYIDINPNKLIS
jgi:hypothetical protein